MVPEGFTNEVNSFDFSAGDHWVFTMIGPDGTRCANTNTNTNEQSLNRLRWVLPSLAA